MVCPSGHTILFGIYLTILHLAAYLTDIQNGHGHTCDHVTFFARQQF